VSFVARNHPQQVSPLFGPDRDTDDRRTPAPLWDPLHAEFGFTLDAAATADNTKCERFCADGLSESWAGHRVWCNPPYSDVPSWVAKAWSEAEGTTGIVMLLPANRTEQRWWQEHVEPWRDMGLVRNGCTLSSRFIAGRQRFDRPAIQVGLDPVNPNRIRLAGR
jgi:phage N-6-adenine-methyltransferase